MLQTDFYYYFTFLHSTHAMGAKTGREKMKHKITKNFNDGVLYVGSASYVLFLKIQTKSKSSETYYCKSNDTIPTSVTTNKTKQNKNSCEYRASDSILLLQQNKTNKTTNC